MRSKYQNRPLPIHGIASLIALLVLPVVACAQEQKSLEDSCWICSYDFETAKASRLFALPDLHSAGSVSYSPNRDLILFDGSVPGKHSTSSSHIFVCKPDGSSMQDLGPGILPSWSPRGKRIVFSRHSPEYGVWMMDADGSEDRLLDNKGWSATWSPNGQMIAYTRQLEGAADFVIFNLVEDEITSIFGDGSSGFDSFEANFAWSPDSRKLCMKAVNDSQSSIATVNVLGSSRTKLHISQEDLFSDVSWLDDSSVITSLKAKSGLRQLFRLSLRNDSNVGPQELPGQFTDRINSDASVNRSGRKLLFVSRKAVK